MSRFITLARTIAKPLTTVLVFITLFALLTGIGAAVTGIVFEVMYMGGLLIHDVFGIATRTASLVLGSGLALILIIGLVNR